MRIVLIIGGMLLLAGAIIAYINAGIGVIVQSTVPLLAVAFLHYTAFYRATSVSIDDVNSTGRRAFALSSGLCLVSFLTTLELPHVNRFLVGIGVALTVVTAILLRGIRGDTPKSNPSDNA